MVKLPVPLLCLVSFIFLVNTGSPEPSTNLKFSGTLTTQTGNNFDIDNIRISRFNVKRQESGVTAYIKPAQSITQSANKEIIFNYSPDKLLVSPLHLNEIKSITVHSPDIIWNFNYFDANMRQKKEMKLMLITVEKNAGTLELLIDPEMEVWFDIMQDGIKKTDNGKASDDHIKLSGVKKLTLKKSYITNCPTNNQMYEKKAMAQQKGKPAIIHEKLVEQSEIVQEVPAQKIQACPAQAE